MSERKGGPANGRDDDEEDDERLDLLTEAELERRGWKRGAPRPRDFAFLYAGFGTALVGALLLAGVVFVSSRDVARQKALVPATGTVVDQRAQSYGTRSRVLLTVRFTTAAGRTVDFELTYDSKDTTRPARGDAVSVLYDSADPAKAELQDSGLAVYAIAGAVGLGFFLVGSSLLVTAFRERRRRAPAHAGRA